VDVNRVWIANQLPADGFIADLYTLEPPERNRTTDMLESSRVPQYTIEHTRYIVQNCLFEWFEIQSWLYWWTNECI